MRAAQTPLPGVSSGQSAGEIIRIMIAKHVIMAALIGRALATHKSPPLSLSDQINSQSARQRLAYREMHTFRRKEHHLTR